MRLRYDVCMVGLGPVGAVTGVCFASQGHRVIGVDVEPARVSCFAKGKAPFVEPQVNQMVAEAQLQGKFVATVDGLSAMADSRVIMLAVGTPTPPSGNPNLHYLEEAAKTVGQALKQRVARGDAVMKEPTIVVVRSTVPPGTMRNHLAPIIEEASGLKMGQEFHVAANPEFLREGRAVEDFFDCARVVIGTDSPAAAEAINALYVGVKGVRLHVSLESAEFAKYVDNSWHATKVAFANEVGRVAMGCGVDVEDMTKIFLSDDKLNISSYYMRSGVPFGGSCLPKDVRGLAGLAARHDIEVPLIESVLPSNWAHIERARQAIEDALLAQGVERLSDAKVGFLGLAFKPEIDDTRESAFVMLAEMMREAGAEVHAYDSAFEEGAHISMASIGRDVASEGDLPLMIASAEAVLAQSELLVLCHDTPEMWALAQRFEWAGKPVIDMTRVELLVPEKVMRKIAANG